MDAAVWLLFFTFAVFLALNVPISISIGLSTLLTMLLTIDPGPAVTTVAQRMAGGLDSFALLAIPFFILSGQLMGRGGIARRLIDFAKVLVGRLPGGLALVDIVACMCFGAISGSAVAATSAIGGFMIPMMNREGYDRDFGTAVTVSAATTGLLIPPSNVLIVYSLASGGVSIAALFIAGYLPGILVGLLLMGVAGFFASARKYPVGEKVGWREGLKKTIGALPSLFLVVLVIGGIIAGIFTATEAGAAAVLYALVLSVVFYREVRLRDIPGILLKSAETTAVVMLLIATSTGMSWVLSYTNIPRNISASLIALSDNPFFILLIINAVLLTIGTFMDMTPAVLIFTPVFLPVVVNLGITPLHFGIVMVLNLCIGLCTPPVGSVLFVGCSIGRTSIQRMTRALWPFYLAMLVSLLLVTAFPDISLALPRLLGY